MGKTVVIGSANTDMAVKSERIPVPGETVLGGRFIMNPGGKGANQAVAAARMGGKVTFIAKVGNDLFGRESITSWKKEGIDVSQVVTDPDHPSGVALIMVDANGENCISVASGANAALRPDDIRSSVIETAGIVLMQLETPVETVLHAARCAKTKGIPVILNPAPATALPDELFPCLHLITPNETEAEMLTGIKVTDEVSARKAAEVLREKGAKNVIITMGKQGAFVFSEDFRGIIPACRVEAVDTTAAGDVFNGALAVCLSEKMALKEAVRTAAKAAAVSVTRMGAQSSAPYRNEVEKTG